MHYLISITKLPKQSVHVSQFCFNHLNHLNVWLVCDQGPLVLELRALPLSNVAPLSGHKLFPHFLSPSEGNLKITFNTKQQFLKICYLRHTLRMFLFSEKVMFRSQDIQVSVFLTISWFTKSVKSWWLLVHEIFLNISFERQLIKSPYLVNW